ncbi:MAG: ankyrin repeat domain-containing protein [Wolbachia endosymbiont of Fragariocoptes setiger]|nr:ankyrin repeat domain-containing protein [Wolbachia endosymbiont of Fragariocoptes setiger]
MSIVTDDQKNLHKELENILINFSNTCNPKSKDLETFLIKNKEKVHCIVNLQTGEDKTTLLHEFSSCAKIVSILLKEGADPDIQDRYGYTPLHIVTRYGYQDVIETFLNYNANPNIKDKYDNTPLCYAVESEEAGIVQSLLDKYETEVNIKNSKTGTPLIFEE